MGGRAWGGFSPIWGHSGRFAGGLRGVSGWFSRLGGGRVRAVDRGESVQGGGGPQSMSCRYGETPRAILWPAKIILHCLTDHGIIRGDLGYVHRARPRRVHLHAASLFWRFVLRIWESIPMDRASAKSRRDYWYCRFSRTCFGGKCPFSIGRMDYWQNARMPRA